MADVSITPRTNGPLLIKGAVQLIDINGNEFKLDRDTIALCRCGSSSNKPFCDGTHNKVEFKAETLAPQE